MSPSETSSGGTEVEREPERPGRLLAGEGAALFEAFNAMRTTKQRHYAMLERLAAKAERYGLGPTVREQGLLDGLLEDHDVQVRRFTRAGAALKARDAEGHRAVFAYIGALEADAPDDPHAH